MTFLRRVRQALNLQGLAEAVRLCEADAGRLVEGHPDAAGWADALEDAEQALRNRLEIVQTARNWLARG